MKVDNQTKLMHAVWLKAYKDGEVTLTLRSKSDVANVRFKLYNAAKVVKNWPVGTNMELEDAVANCSISILGPTQLSIYRSDKSVTMQDLAAQIGVTLDPQADVRQMEDEAAAMLERMGLVPAPEVKRDEGVNPVMTPLMQRYASIREEG